VIKLKYAKDDTLRRRRLETGALLELWIYEETPDEVLEEIDHQRSDYHPWDGEFVIIKARAADDWHAKELANALGQNLWTSQEFKYGGVACIALVVHR